MPEGGRIIAGKRGANCLGGDLAIFAVVMEDAGAGSNPPALLCNNVISKQENKEFLPQNFRSDQYFLGSLQLLSRLRFPMPEIKNKKKVEQIQDLPQSEKLALPLVAIE